MCVCREIKILKHTVVLKQNYEFRRLYAKGLSASTSLIVLYCRKTGRPYNRVGYTVSKKIGKAVVRNRIRRRFREIYRLHEPELTCGYDLIVVARGRAAGAEYRQLDRDFIHLAKKLHLWENPA